MNDKFVFPEWYQSTSGPKVSATIINTLFNVIPIVNMFLANKGINILPEEINSYVSIGVFIFFGIRTILSYVKAKIALGDRIKVLEHQVVSLGGRVE